MTVRPTQLAVEVIYVPTDTKVRTTQVAVEVIYKTQAAGEPPAVDVTAR